MFPIFTDINNRYIFTYMFTVFKQFDQPENNRL